MMGKHSEHVPREGSFARDRGEADSVRTLDGRVACGEPAHEVFYFTSRITSHTGLRGSRSGDNVVNWTFVDAFVWCVWVAEVRGYFQSVCSSVAETVGRLTASHKT